MNAALCDKFNEAIDVEELAEDVKSSGSTERLKVPYGDYEVAITKLELAESKAEQPMAKVWFKIVAGEFRGQMLFMNQMLTSGFGIHFFNEFLESLGTGLPIEFKNFAQFDELLDSVFTAVDGSYEYQLEYAQNTKNPKFNTFTIKNKFDK